MANSTYIRAKVVFRKRQKKVVNNLSLFDIYIFYFQTYVQVCFQNCGKRNALVLSKHAHIEKISLSKVKGEDDALILFFDNKGVNSS